MRSSIEISGSKNWTCKNPIPISKPKIASSLFFPAVLEGFHGLLEWIVKDYNHARPHHSLRGLSPFEALTGKQLLQEQWNTQILEAKQARIKENIARTCGIC